MLIMMIHNLSQFREFFFPYLTSLFIGNCLGLMSSYETCSSGNSINYDSYQGYSSEGFQSNTDYSPHCVYEEK